eukprot:scaffold36783_cov16-Tisochrysis_lutea.AAC.1
MSEGSTKVFEYVQRIDLTKSSTSLLGCTVCLKQKLWLSGEFVPAHSPSISLMQEVLLMTGSWLRSEPLHEEIFVPETAFKTTYDPGGPETQITRDVVSKARKIINHFFCQRRHWHESARKSISSKGHWQWCLITDDISTMQLQGEAADRRLTSSHCVFSLQSEQKLVPRNLASAQGVILRG